MKPRISYKIIESKMRKRISNSEWLPSEKIPSYRDLANEYECSISTIEKAVKNLETAGFIKIEAKKRPIVSDHISEIKKNGLVAIFVPTVDHQLWSSAIRGAETYLYDFKFSIITISTERNMNKMRQSVKNLFNLPLDGVIVAPFDHNMEEREEFNEIMTQLQAKGIKIVFLDRFKHDMYIPYVTTENVNGAYRLTKHLIDNGHTKIGFVRTTNTSSVTERFVGFQQACYDNHIGNDGVIDLYFKTHEEDFVDEMPMFEQMIMDTISNKRVTALFCSNDQNAKGVLVAVERLKLKIPEDISLVTYDVGNIQHQNMCKLTGIKQDFYGMGYLCAEVLLGLLNGNIDVSATNSRVVPVSMVIGNSVKKLVDDTQSDILSV